MGAFFHRSFLTTIWCPKHFQGMYFHPLLLTRKYFKNSWKFFLLNFWHFFKFHSFLLIFSLLNHVQKMTYPRLFFGRRKPGKFFGQEVGSCKGIFLFNEKACQHPFFFMKHFQNVDRNLPSRLYLLCRPSRMDFFNDFTGIWGAKPPKKIFAILGIVSLVVATKI